MSTSKTARASMVKTVSEKIVISDEEHIKNLRNDIASALHVTQEGAKALLRAYDRALVTINELNIQDAALAEQTEATRVVNVSLIGQIEKLENELNKLRAEQNDTAFERDLADAKNNQGE